MAKVKYLGPGDSVTLDGITIKKGEEVDLTHEQIFRLNQSGGSEVQVEPAEDRPESRAKIQDGQNKLRDETKGAEGIPGSVNTESKT